MKKFILIVLAFVLVFGLISCSADDYVCYYGYFTDTAFSIIYSSKKNALYYVNLPLEMIVNWGTQNGIDSVPEVIRNFAGFKESGFMLGNGQTLQALRDILDAMSSESEPDIESRIKVIAERSAVFLQQPLLLNMNRLCSCDITNLIKSLNGKNASVAVMDAKVVFSDNNLPFSKQYFQSWIKQIIE